MVSRRKRANSSVGNKLNSLTDKVTGQEKLQQVSGTQTNAVTNDSIALGAVNTESVSDRSITSAKIGRGEVTSENLGVINEIVASGGLDIEVGVDGHVSLSGGKYEEPYDGIEDGDGYKVVAFDPTNNALKVIDAYPPAESGLRFDTTYTEGSTAVGMLSWTDEFETLEFFADANVSVQIGQETLYRVKNASGSVAIPKFRLVMFAGATGDTVTVSPATATAIRDNPTYVVGITAEEIAADGFGFVTHFGFIEQVNTNSFTLGALLYLDPNTTTGVLTSTRPSAPFFRTPIAAVTRVQTNSGRVLVRMDSGSKVGDLHDVHISGGLADGDLLRYNSANARWESVSGGALLSIVKYTSTSGAITVPTGAKAVKVICVGGGGGGGSAASTSSTQTAIGQGGSGAGCSEAFITDLSTLASPMYAVVGAGGAGGSVSTAGAAGGNSWFGSSNSVITGALVTAVGGSGGAHGTAGSGNRAISGVDGAVAGVVPNANDLAVPGGDSTGCWVSESVVVCSGQAGHAGRGFGFGAMGQAVSGAVAGAGGQGFGGGGSGAAVGRSTGASRAGGSGTAGIVILEWYR